MRFAVLVCVAAVGCGPSDWNDFRNQLTARSCDRDVKCGVIGQSERPTCDPPLSILAYITPQDPAAPADVDAAIHHGRMRFNSDDAQRCLDALSGAPCDNSVSELRVGLACHHVIEPAVAPGGDCFGGGECEGGWCDQPSLGCAGVCRAFPSPGAPCDPLGGPAMQCDPSVQYCGDPNPPDGGEPDGGAPGGLHCLRHKQAGDPCQHDEECSFGLICLGTCQSQPQPKRGDVCNAPGLCTDGVYCDSTGICSPQKKAAAACDSAFACEKGSACIGFVIDPLTKAVTPGTCTPWLDLGAACTPPPMTLPQLVTGCPLSQLCTAGTCASPPGAMRRAGANQPCSPMCADSLRCDGALCRYRLGLGADCTATEECAQGTTCNQTCILPGVTCH